jgi:hypothetical protein
MQSNKARIDTRSAAHRPNTADEMRRSWGRYLDLDAPVEDLLTELAAIVHDVPGAAGKRARELVIELHKRHDLAAVAIQTFCNLAVGRQP